MDFSQLKQILLWLPYLPVVCIVFGGLLGVYWLVTSLYGAPIVRGTDHVGGSIVEGTRGLRTFLFWCLVAGAIWFLYLYWTNQIQLPPLPLNWRVYVPT